MFRYKVKHKTFALPSEACTFAREQAEAAGEPVKVFVESIRPVDRVHKQWLATMYPPSHERTLQKNSPQRSLRASAEAK